MIEVKKPWGRELIWAHTDRYAGKFLYITNGCRLSRQFHNKKQETICVVSGQLRLEIGEEPVNVQTLEVGQKFDITPGMIHRFCANKGDVVLVEVSTPELDDIVRLEDDYER